MILELPLGHRYLNGLMVLCLRSKCRLSFYMPLSSGMPYRYNFFSKFGLFLLRNNSNFAAALNCQCSDLKALQHLFCFCTYFSRKMHSINFPAGYLIVQKLPDTGSYLETQQFNSQSNGAFNRSIKRLLAWLFRLEIKLLRCALCIDACLMSASIKNLTLNCTVHQSGC